MYNKKIQLLRNGNIYTPSNGATALQTAMSTISQMQGVSDGEVILARYRESQNSEVKTLLCIHYEGSTESGWTFFSDEVNCKTKYVDLSSNSNSSQSIDPYQMTDFGTVNTSTLQISFNTAKEVSGYTKEYTIKFVAGQNMTTLTLPQGVLWANSVAPTIVAGHTYEINIINNCAVFGEFY